MRHRHTWQTIAVVHLSLPTTERLSQLACRWECTGCNAFCEITGEFQHGMPIRTPEYWQALQAQEHRRGTPEARMARQQGRALPRRYPRSTRRTP